MDACLDVNDVLKFGFEIDIVEHMIQEFSRYAKARHVHPMISHVDASTISGIAYKSGYSYIAGKVVGETRPSMSPVMEPPASRILLKSCPLGVPMPILTWNESLRLGVEAIDDEHKILLATLNGVLETGDESSAPQDGAEFIDRLLALATDHFRHEEELMMRIGYPELESHRRAHVKLREQARFLKKVLEGEENPALVRVELAGFLSEWLGDHLAGMDLLMRPYIQRHVALNGPL